MWQTRRRALKPPRLVIRFQNRQYGTKTAYVGNVQEPEFIFTECWINHKDTTERGDL